MQSKLLYIKILCVEEERVWTSDEWIAQVQNGGYWNWAYQNWFSWELNQQARLSS